MLEGLRLSFISATSAVITSGFDIMALGNCAHCGIRKNGAESQPPRHGSFPWDSDVLWFMTTVTVENSTSLRVEKLKG